MDDAIGVASNLHVERLEVISVDGLPELVFCLGTVDCVFQQGDKLLGELVVKVHLTEHDPRIPSANGHAGNAVI